MRFFECKVKYDKMLENGELKSVTETYAVDALSFTEAEARITEKMKPFAQGDFEVVAEKIAPYFETTGNNMGFYYLCKFTHIVTNETTGKESKKHLGTILICAEDFDEAKSMANEYMCDSLADWQIDTLKETKIVDVFTYDTAPAN